MLQCLLVESAFMPSLTTPPDPNDYSPQLEIGWRYLQRSPECFIEELRYPRMMGCPRMLPLDHVQVCDRNTQEYLVLWDPTYLNSTSDRFFVTGTNECRSTKPQDFTRQILHWPAPFPLPAIKMSVPNNDACIQSPEEN